jgi:NAD(P)-dependent dehydrogenase (short-subunit alcohol dehydrogenase family)
VTATAPSILRPRLLDGLELLLASAEPPSRFGEAVAARCADLGAHMGRVVVEPTGDEGERREGVDVLVWDGASLAGPRDVLDGAWLALRPQARAMIDSQQGGKLVLVAPPPADAGAEAARAGTENLARTLSIEWARYGIRTAAVLPGAATEPAEVAELTAFLASRAGDYYSGCRFAMGEA